MLPPNGVAFSIDRQLPSQRLFLLVSQLCYARGSCVQEPCMQGPRMQECQWSDSKSGTRHVWHDESEIGLSTNNVVG
jgi:hypothetical protein